MAVLMGPRNIPKDTRCANCKNHFASSWWIGEGGIHALTHGGGEPWCECCVTTEQLAYARRQSEKIAALEADLLRQRALEDIEAAARG